jgi:hypothetical protein
MTKHAGARRDRRSPTPLAPCCPDHAGDDMRVLIAAAVPGQVFGLGRAQANRPPNVVRRPVRTIRLLVDAIVTGHGEPRLGIRTGDFD